MGLARTGRLHAFEREDFVPDIVVFGKGLGGGLPISAAVGPERVMNHRSAFSFQTLHGNPASASAALAVLQAIETEGLADPGGKDRRSADRAAAGGGQGVGVDRRRAGRGLAIGVELIEDPRDEGACPAACRKGGLPDLGARRGDLLRRDALERAGADAAGGERGGRELIDQGADLILAPCDFDFGGPASREAQTAGLVGLSALRL